METSIPPYRKLKGYAFDPSLSLKEDTAFINSLIYMIPWEDLEEGPRGEYLEVIDYDPTTETFLSPVNLNDPFILAQDGLTPSESNPQYHQQMCYAVAMTTIKNFEKALGRKILWSPYPVMNKEDSRPSDSLYVKQLRIYPHALRDANAFYSPIKKALLFGYFSSNPEPGLELMPNSLVFSCLSHDIIAHETTHAILDGIHNKYSEDTNPDVHAFHEAIADIVALFQHFTFPVVLRHQIAKTRGELDSQNLLGELAHEFGSAIGNYGALRDAIGERNETTHRWQLKSPTGLEYQQATEPHKRGAVLVSAVFEAFLTIYKTRTADLFRIATGGTGVVPAGSIHPDLVNRLAEEASKASGHVLNMCIRALDYCPPVDISFGDFLRGIITADYHLFEEDSCNYRIAFIEAFRRRGIFPRGIKNLSEDSLRYKTPELGDASGSIKNLCEKLRKFSYTITYESDRQQIFEKTKGFIIGKNENSESLHKQIVDTVNKEAFEKLTGLVFQKDFKSFGVYPSKTYGDKVPGLYIRSLKLASRIGSNGKKINQIILTLTQNARFRYEKTGKIQFLPDLNDSAPFTVMGGSTLIFDLDSMTLKTAISKPILNQDSLPGVRCFDEERFLSLYRYMYDNTAILNPFRAYFTPASGQALLEPFSMLHRY